MEAWEMLEAVQRSWTFMDREQRQKVNDGAPLDLPCWGRNLFRDQMAACQHPHRVPVNGDWLCSQCGNVVEVR